MKKLIFIDNDNKTKADETIKQSVIPALVAYGNIDEKDAKEIEVIHDLYTKDRDTLYDIFFSKKNAILSWSVYTATSFSNSKSQLLSFLRIAGGADIMEATYIDTSGMIKDTLNNVILFEEVKGLYSILQAIETNNIITISDGMFFRIRLDIGNALSPMKSAIILQKVDLSEILKL